MTRNLLSSGVIAGAATALVVAILQLWLIQPLIVEAEMFETGIKVLATSVTAATEMASNHEATESSDGIDVTRASFTVLFLIVTWSGFGLLAVSGIAVLRHVLPSLAVSAPAIALVGFATFSLMPALGLPPELPGMPAADLATRQIWWVATALATFAAVVAALRFWSYVAWLGAVALVAGPHLIGAPMPPIAPATVPPDLAALYTARVLGVSFLGWMLCGSILMLLSGREDTSQVWQQPR